MWFGTDEERTERINDIADGYMRAAALYPYIVDVLKDFDGKCFNRRINEAIHDRSGENIYTDQLGSFIEIYCYSDGKRHTLFRIKKSDDGSKTRINAEECIVSANEYRINHLQKAEGMKKALIDGPIVKNKIEELAKKINELADSLPYEAREYYRIPSHIHI